MLVAIGEHELLILGGRGHTDSVRGDAHVIDTQTNQVRAIQAPNAEFKCTRGFSSNAFQLSPTKVIFPTYRQQGGDRVYCFAEFDSVLQTVSVWSETR